MPGIVVALIIDGVVPYGDIVGELEWVLTKTGMETGGCTIVGDDTGLDDGQVRLPSHDQIRR